MTTVSGLMAVYHRDDPRHLKLAVESLLKQTRPLDQLVIVIDGPIGADLDAVLPIDLPYVQVLRLARNQGLAYALNVGLDACTGEWIMRMDSDDISLPDRLEIQLIRSQEEPHADIITTWCEEFFESTDQTRIKSSPVTHDALMQALRWRNILVHPTVLIRAQILRDVGGYRTDYALLEDYDLFVRLALAKAKFAVIPKVLLRFRTSSALVSRRGGLKYCFNEMRFRRQCWSQGFLTTRQYVVSSFAYLIFRLAGTGLRGLLYIMVRTRTPKAS